MFLILTTLLVGILRSMVLIVVRAPTRRIRTLTLPFGPLTRTTRYDLPFTGVNTSARTTRKRTAGFVPGTTAPGMIAGLVPVVVWPFDCTAWVVPLVLAALTATVPPPSEAGSVVPIAVV